MEDGMGSPRAGRRQAKVRRGDGRRARRSGFTLVELMVVILILGILATAVTLKVSGYLSKSKRVKATTDIQTLKNALELWRMENDRYPTSEEGLAILMKPTKDHPEGIVEAIPLDPWGHPYDYVCPGRHGTYDIISYGRDGTEGGEGEDADIESWDLEKKKD